jgi:hypothetical protein
LDGVTLVLCGEHVNAAWLRCTHGDLARGCPPARIGAGPGQGRWRLDELAIALDIAIAATVPGPVTADLRRAGGRVTVTVSPVAHERLRGRRTLLEGLAASVVSDGDAIALSLDA